MMDAYTKDGVNVAAGDALSTIAAKFCRQTNTYARPYVVVHEQSGGAEHHRSPRSFTLANLPTNHSFGIAPDGIGTKVGISQALNTVSGYLGNGYDLLGMTVGDIDRWGGLAVIFSSVLDVRHTGADDSLTRRMIAQLYQGLALGAHDVGVVMFNGETAELGEYVGSEIKRPTVAFNWSGFALGIYNNDRIINGSRLAAGQPVVALEERGFRSNGISSVRKAFARKYDGLLRRWGIPLGNAWWSNPKACADLKEAAHPSTLYSTIFKVANGWADEPPIDITYIAHITGGGIRDKFGRDAVLRRGFSATLDELFLPPMIMQKCAEWRGMSGKELYATWNGGQGKLVVLADDREARRFTGLAAHKGIRAKVCGRIEDAKDGVPRLTILSRYSSGEVVSYTMED